MISYKEHTLSKTDAGKLVLGIIFGWFDHEGWRLIDIELLGTIPGADGKTIGVRLISITILKLNLTLYIEK
jgi:hypothetical protein